MQILDVYYDNKENKYIIQFEANGVTWFRELSTPHVYHSPKTFKKWLESLVEDIKIRL